MKALYDKMHQLQVALDEAMAVFRFREHMEIAAQLFVAMDELKAIQDAADVLEAMCGKLDDESYRALDEALRLLCSIDFASRPGALARITERLRQVNQGMAN